MKNDNAKLKIKILDNFKFLIVVLHFNILTLHFILFLILAKKQ
jgi:hypothetical protein